MASNGYLAVCCSASKLGKFRYAAKVAALVSLTTASALSMANCDVYIVNSHTQNNIEASLIFPNILDVESENLQLQVENFQLCKDSKAYSDDLKFSEVFREAEEVLITLLNKDIADFPVKEDIQNPQDVITSDTELYQELLVSWFLGLSVAHYLGDFVPKDDTKAVLYAKKVADFVQNNDPEASSWLVHTYYSTINRFAELVNSENPMAQQAKSEKASYIAATAILYRAGHVDTNVDILSYGLLFARDFNNPDEFGEWLDSADFRLQINRIESYANNNSHLAILVLAEFYSELNDVNDDFAEKAKYWQERAEKLPEVSGSWN